MANYGTTTRRALRKLLGTSQRNEIDEGIGALADDIDAIMAVDDQGAFSARPASGTANKKGRYYTDEFGATWRDDGTVWRYVGGKPPGASVSRVATFPLGHQFKEPIPFDTEAEDDRGMHASNSTDIIVPFAGLWLLTGSVEFAANATGYREFQFTSPLLAITNGRWEQMTVSSGIPTHMFGSAAVRLAAGTAIQLSASQASGGTLNVTAALRVDLIGS